MKLTKKEEWFIEDVRTLIERGETFINLDQWNIQPKVANDLLSCYLGIDVWFNVYSVPFSGRYCKLETDFSKRYISNFFANEFNIITPQPFEIIYDSSILTVSEDEQLKIHNDGVKWYKENIQNPTKPTLRFWQKVKQFFA
jgi:hypothetical protein